MPTLADGLQNLASGLGTEKSKRSNRSWVYSLNNNYAQLEAAYQTSWIARKICDFPAEDMTREWRSIAGESAEEISRAEEEILLPNIIQEAVTWARLFGGAGILMLTDQDLTKPLNLNLIKQGSLKRLIPLDRFDLSANLINTWDVLAENYLLPENYTIRGGKVIVHHSHIARFVGERLPKRSSAIMQGWGDSVLRKCIEDIEDMVESKGGIAELMTECNIDVITREGLSDELASDMDDELIKRYSTFSLMKSICNMALLDGPEKLDRQTLSLTGVSDTLQIFLTMIAGAADIPITRMFGTSAKGLNATGEGDDKNYMNSIRAAQRSYLAEPMRKLDEVFVRSTLGFFPDDYSYSWNPLVQPDALQLAQVEKTRTDKHLALLEQGIITKSQIMRQLQANDEYQFDDEMIDELEELEKENIIANAMENLNEEEKVQGAETGAAEQSGGNELPGAAEKDSPDTES